MGRPKIQVGYQVGMLCVVEKTTQRQHGYTIWKCVCECGNILELDTRTLQRGSKKDCGCKTKLPARAVDLTNQRFGKLIAKSPTLKRSKSGDILWACECDCGNTTEIAAHLLLNGNTKSCGCLKYPPLKTFIGQTFGQLTVTDYAGKRAGMHRWKCRCKCGNETIVGQTLLQSGKTKSCGCLQSMIYKDNLKLIEGTSVTLLEATLNRPTKNNSSGVVGVYQNKKTQKWIAQMTFKKKTYYLGSYDKKEDAIIARKKGEEMMHQFLDWYYQEKE